MKFKDHFSRQASDYKNFRPDYPEALYDWLAKTTPAHDLVWDCGTGNGQAAGGLAKHFKKVSATDASARQIANAQPVDNVEYRVAPAENSQIATATVDLVTVAQAFHWFDQARFFAEAKRVLKNNGMLAVWTYNLLTIAPEIDALILEFYHGDIASYWPPERLLVENDYRDIEFPLVKIDTPQFEMKTEWTCRQLLGYLGTWSAAQKFKEATGKDPVQPFAEKIGNCWGELDRAKVAIWPMPLHAGRFI